MRPASAADAGLCWQVVQAIGAAEAELLNWGLPKRIDGDGAINLIKAAEASGVSQYLMVRGALQSVPDEHKGPAMSSTMGCSTALRWHGG